MSLLIMSIVAVVLIAVFVLATATLVKPFLEMLERPGKVVRASGADHAATLTVTVPTTA